MPALSLQSHCTEAHLLAYAVGLGGTEVAGFSAAEREVLETGFPRIPSGELKFLRRLVRIGCDPLGEQFTALRSAVERRPLGATYTPPTIVSAMLDWAAQHGEPDRVVDPGTGSGRFLLEAGRRFPRAQLLGVEVDPVAALIARGNLRAAGFSDRARIELCDYRLFRLPPTDGKTLFIGNPPYVRHHLLSQESKKWLVTEAEQRGLGASQLAGLHVYFFLATVALGQQGDFGAFITAAEWLDVNYGKLVRDLFLNGLGGQSLLMVDPAARPFPDAASTAAISTFVIGSRPRSIRLRRVSDLRELGTLHGGALVRRERLAAEHRWTHLLRVARPVPEGHVELGELCRVHRGQVTGANRVWIDGDHSRHLPDSVLFPTVTRARELFAANGVLSDASSLRRVIDLPVDLDTLATDVRAAVDRFLRWARSQGTDKGYIARNRRAWWSVRLREPPPIMATYMARRPPAFVLNSAQARYINIAHGLYPREPLSDLILERLVAHLVANSANARGRSYAGGLMKFEPREMERIVVPAPELLAAGWSG